MICVWDCVGRLQRCERVFSGLVLLGMAERCNGHERDVSWVVRAASGTALQPFHLAAVHVDVTLECCAILAWLPST